MENGDVTLGFNPQIGDKAHVLYYSDIHPCTDNKTTKQFVTVQTDTYKLNQEIKPTIIAGGFAGHCTNNANLSTTSQETKRRDYKFGLRQDGRWCQCGSISKPNRLGRGWRVFYDYNFGG